MDTAQSSRRTSVTFGNGTTEPDVGYRCFVQDLIPPVPPAALLQDLRYLGQTVAIIASGIAGGASDIVHSYSFQSESQSQHSDSTDSQSQSQQSDSTDSSHSTNSQSPSPDRDPPA